MATNARTASHGVRQLIERIRRLREVVGHRVVLIVFDRERGSWRADEVADGHLVAGVTEGWLSGSGAEDETEDLARLYAAMRELTIARVDS